MKSLFLNKSKKYIVGFLCAVFVANLFFLMPREAKAEMPVSVVADPGMVVLNETAALIGFQNAGLLTDQTIATADQVAQSKWQTIVKFVSDKLYQVQNLIFSKADNVKEYILDPLFWTMANVVIDQFGDAIVDWIRNGFDGGPMFLSDPEGFFRDTANQASGAIISKFNAEWLCSPLGKLKIDLNFLFPGTDRVNYGCTFNDIAGNFKDIAGRRDLDDWVDFNVSVAENDIVKNFSSDYRNGGFLMWLTTADWKNNDVGATLRLVDDAFIAASAKISLGAFQLDLGQGFFGVKKCLAYDVNNNCVKEITTSPGQLVQDQLKLVAGKDLSRLEVADEINARI